LERNERQRCRELAKMKAALPRWLAESRKKYLANQDRVATPRKTAEALLHRKGDGAGPRLWKPSDVWNFSQVAFDKLPDNQDPKSYGYIPGEVYANVFAYWSRPGDVVVAPMAGSGMIFRVYEERHRWMGAKPWEVDLRGADLSPRGEYKDRIAQRDALEEIEGPTDLIVIDIPYFCLIAGKYSKNPTDLANMTDLDRYDDALHRPARSCRKAQRVGGRTVVIAASAYADVKTREEVQIDVRVIVAFRRVGYEPRRGVSAPR
jgi:ParB family chromosome partitioning protein